MAKLTTLRGLELARCALVTGAGLRRLGRLNKLAYLDVGVCDRIDDDGLGHMTSLAN